MFFRNTIKALQLNIKQSVLPFPQQKRMGCFPSKSVESVTDAVVDGAKDAAEKTKDIAEKTVEMTKEAGKNAADDSKAEVKPVTGKE